MSEVLTNIVQSLRREKGVTQEQIAQELGVTRQTIIAIEKGNYTPSVVLAMKIANYFNTQVERIFLLKS